MAKYVVFDAELFSICVSSAKLSGKWRVANTSISPTTPTLGL
jgi:hypothetical protein